MKPLLVAISGPSGSGKSLLASTITEELNQAHPKNVILISEDAYYKDLSSFSMSERQRVNYDHPDAFDYTLMIEQLSALMSGRSIDLPQYDYACHTRSVETKLVEPANIVIVEGILMLSKPELNELFDLRIYVDTPLDICLSRRIKRDIESRGRDLDSVISQYLATVRPMYFQFIEPSKLNADLLVPHGGKNRAAIDIIKAKLISSLIN